MIGYPWRRPTAFGDRRDILMNVWRLREAMSSNHRVRMRCFSKDEVDLTLSLLTEAEAERVTFTWLEPAVESQQQEDHK